MITLISSSDKEQSTDEVIDWLFFKNQSYERVNGSDISDDRFSVTLSNKGKHFKFHKNKFVEDLSNIKIHKNFLWFRRWYDHASNDEQKYLLSSNLKNRGKDCATLHAHMNNEKEIFSDWFLEHLNKSYSSLDNSGFLKINKLEVLELASKMGLSIPETLVTNSKMELVKFLNIHGRIITKAISESLICYGKLPNENSAIMYTEEITNSLIRKLPEHFGVSLFQPLLKKQFELRVFNIEKKFYPMAIFSQSNTKTKVDFRRYDYDKPNRCVPFKLPKKVENKLWKLLKYMDIQSASIDMIYTCENEFVFLEVNPNGQFGMVSKPCNYYLEEKIADFLIKNSR